MLEGFPDEWPLFRWAGFHAFHTLPIGSGADRQPVEFFTVSNPAGFGRETILLLHPFLDLLVGCFLRHRTDAITFSSIVQCFGLRQNLQARARPKASLLQFEFGGAVHRSVRRHATLNRLDNAIIRKDSERLGFVNQLVDNPGPVPSA